MPASAIKDALLWRSQLHRQTVISFLVLLETLNPPFPPQHPAYTQEKHKDPQAHANLVVKGQPIEMNM